MALALIAVWLSVPSSGQFKIKRVSLNGEVVAYIKPHVIVPPNSLNGEKLLARVTRPGSSKIEYLWLLKEFFGNQSDLPAQIYGSGVTWEFKATRRVDCDSTLRPRSSTPLESSKTANDDENGGEFILDDPPAVTFIVSEQYLSIPAGKVLPCYQILSLKQK